MGAWSIGQRSVGLAAAALVATLGSVAARASAQARIPCRPGPGTTTIAHSKNARIFEDSRTENDYACLYSNGHPHLLSPSEHYGYPIVRFAGPYVAYVPTTEGSQGETTVMDMRSGHKHSYEAVQPYETNNLCGEVVSLVLKSDGAVAWTARNLGEACPHAPPATVEVRVHDRHGLRVLESNAGIVPSSLHLSDSTLSWLKSGETRTATLY
jgi:hypothetical protein